MRKVLIKFVTAIVRMSEAIGRIAGYGILAMIGIMLTEVFLRYGLNSPTKWSLEMNQFILGAYFFLGGAYVLLHEEHVRMDSFYHKWSKKKKAVADVATFVLFAVYLVTFIIGGVWNVEYSVKFKQHSKTLWGPPLAPIKIVIVVGVVILLLQGVAILIKDIAVLTGREIPGPWNNDREDKEIEK